MSLENTLNRLNNDEDYYGSFGKKYLSNSDIGTLLSNPKQFGKDKERTLPMLQGSYFHTAMLEPHKLEDFEIVSASTRNTKIYKEAVENSEESMLLLAKEVDELEKCIDTMKSNFFFFENIYQEGNKYEVPMIKEIMGFTWKGKADIETEDCLIDIKTTGDIDNFKYSSKKYNYDSQAYIYEQLFGKPLVFYVVCKKSLRLGVFEPTEEFLASGKKKTEEAVKVYNRFFSEDSEENVDNYFLTQKLF